MVTLTKLSSAHGLPKLSSMSPRRITPFSRRTLFIVLVVPSVVFPMSQVLLSLMPRNDFPQKSASTRFFFVRNGNKCGKSITFAGKVGHCVKAGPQKIVGN